MPLVAIIVMAWLGGIEMISAMNGHNNRLHSDKIKLRRFAPLIYFAGEARR